MNRFVNTAALIGDDALCDQIITRTLTEFSDNTLTGAISAYSLNHFPSLTKVDLPNATTIGAYSFEGCSLLSSVRIPSVVTVYEYTFSNCTALETLDLPSATVIGRGCWQNCTNFRLLILRAGAVCSLLNANAFQGTLIASGTGYIYVPKALIAEYQAATNWSTYAAQFRALEDYTVDGTLTGELDETKI